MNVSIGKRWQELVDGLIDSGRYESASEIINEELRLVEEREAKLRAAREAAHTVAGEAGSHASSAAVGSPEDEKHDKREAKLASLRAALIEGEQSGPSTPFDFQGYIAAKRRMSKPPA